MDDKHKILTKTLPSILDELEGTIRQVEELAKAVQEAAGESSAV